MRPLSAGSPMSNSQAATINVGSVFERVFSTYAQIWKPLIVGALVVFGPIAVLAGVALTSGSAGGGLLLVVVAIVAGYWYQGMVVETVRDVQDGKVDGTVGELLRSAGPSVGSLFVVGFLGALGIAIGLIALIIPGLILMTIWAVAAPVVVIERKSAFQAFSRSRELVSGNGWPVFGTLVALFAGNILLSMIGSAIGSASTGAAIVAQLAQYLVIAPVSAIAAAILYFALREAHGDSVLARPTGVLSGGFVPPVAPPRMVKLLYKRPT